MNFAAVLLITVCACALSAREIELDIGASGADALPAALLKEVEGAYQANMRGLDALEHGQFDLALAQFDRAIEIVPAYTDAKNNRGVVYYRRGILYEARKIWESLVAAEPKYQIAWHNLGIIAYHEKKYDDARRYFKKALKINRRQVQTLVALGRMDLEQGKTRDGLTYLEKAFTVSPQDHDVWSSYAWGLLAQGDTASALLLLKTHDTDSEALRLMGSIAAAQGRHDDAVRLLTRAARDGAGPELLLSLATSLEEQKEHAGALDVLERYFSAAGGSAVADAWLLAGIAAKEADRADDAIRYFEEGSKRFPSDPLLKQNLGQMYFFRKQFDKAENVWKELSDTLADPTVLYLRALGAMHSGQLARARDMVLKALALDDRAEFHDLNGVLAYRSGDTASAATSFRKALALNPNLRSAQLNLAVSGQNPDDRAAAVEQLRKEVQACKTDCADPAFRLSVMLYNGGNYAAAAQTLQAVPEKDRDERLYRHLAIYLKRMHDYEQAVAVLEKARARFVIDPQTEYELADIYLLAGHYDKAVDVFTRLIQRWEGNPWRLYYQLGYAFMENNELDKARGNFEKSLKLNKDNVAARGVLAYVLNRMGEMGQARELWERNLKNDPDNPAIWINLGLSYEAVNEFGKALDAYNKAQRLSPANKAIAINLGNAFAGMGRIPEAMDAYNQALNSPKRELALYNILLLAAKERNIPRAREMLAAAEKEFPSSDFTLRGRSVLALAGGDTASALRSLKAITTPIDSDWYQLARVYALQGNAADARAALDKLPHDAMWEKARTDIAAQIAYSEGQCDEALKMWGSLTDSSFVFQYNVALACYQCKRFGEVIDRATHLVKSATGRDRADLCRLAGNAAFALKDWTRARLWYNQLSNVEAGSAVVQYNLAVAHYNLNDMHRAWSYYQRAQALDPSLKNSDIEKRHAALDSSPAATVLDSLAAMYNTAVDSQQAKNDSGAEKLYRRIVAADPAFVLAWNNLGALYAARGEVDSAEAMYLRAVEKKHDLPESYANLINLYLALGDFSEARRWTIKGRGHNPDSELLEQIETAVADSLDAVQKTAVDSLRSERN